MKEFLTLIRLLSPRNLLHFLLLLKKEPKRYILANLNQKVQSLRSPYQFKTKKGHTKELKLIANGFVRDEFYKIKGSIQCKVELSMIDSSGTLNHKIELTKTGERFSFDTLVKVDAATKKNALFLKIQDQEVLKKIKLSKFNLSAKRNCNKTEVYRMKVDEEKNSLIEKAPEHHINENILFSFILENNTIQDWDITNTLSSLENQIYQNWELLVPVSKKNETRIKDINHHKVRFIEIEELYTTKSRNQLINQSEGNYVGIIEDRDQLHPHALDKIYITINNHPKLSLAYCDSDTINKNKERVLPKYKPSLSIDHLRCMNYIGTFYIFSKETFKKLSAYDVALNLVSSHYDFILRLIDNDARKNHVVHVDHILHHENQGKKTSMQASKVSLDDMKAIASHLDRNHITATVHESKYDGIYNIEYKKEKEDLISILIPFKNESEVLKTCINSILTKTTYPNYEIILIDHESTEKAVIDFYEELVSKHNNIKCLHYKGDFNYSAINNWAVKSASGSYFVFLNNDTEILTAGWLDRMYQYGVQKNIGVVGVLLLYPDNTIQHDGVYFGYLDKELKYPTSQYINKMQNIGDENAYYPYVVKNVKAVTAACIMVSKEDFLSVGGFDEIRFKVTCNDTDLCFRIGKEKRIVSLPDVILTHYESKSRGLNDTFKKIRLAQRELKLFYDLHHDQFEEKEIIFNV